GRSRPKVALNLMRAYNTCWKYIDARRVQKLAQQLSLRYRLAVLTNQVVGFQLEKMNKIDPQGRWFEYFLTSEEVGVEKPASRFFREACRKMKCRPQEAVMVGDSWEKDVLGALNAGMRAIYVHRGSRPKKWRPRVIHIQDLVDVEDALRELE